jgi:hypothetical protein
VREPSAKRRTCRVARPSPSVCCHLATPTPVRRPSPSRSNLGTGSHSTYHAPTTKAHGTPSVAIDYGRRSTRRAVLHAVLELPRPQTSASSRRSGSASLPTTRVQSGGASWWSQRTNHHGSTRRTPRGHVESRATLTVPKDGWRSSAKQYLRAPATYVSSSKRQGCRCSTTLRTTWVRLWHVSSRPISRHGPMRPWLTSESPQP